MRPGTSTALVPAVLVAVLLTGCGGTSSGTSSGTSGAVATPTTSAGASSSPGATDGPAGATPTTALPPDPSQPAAGRELRITVTGKKVDPAPDTLEVEVGEPVRFVITSDHDDEVHLHGVEIEKPVVAGTPLTVTATYTEPGSYEVELHSPPLLLVRVLVR